MLKQTTYYAIKLNVFCHVFGIEISKEEIKGYEKQMEIIF